MKKIVFLYLGLVGFHYSYGQEKDAASEKQKCPFMDNITLRQSFQSKNDKAEPAIFTYTNPEDKDESWLVNAAIGYNFICSSNLVLTVDPYIEFHKNTLVDKEQENWQAGVASEWQVRDMSKKAWSPILIGAIKYNVDKVKENNSLQGNLYFTPLFKGKGGEWEYFWIPNNASNFGKFCQFVYTPYIGFENENRTKTELETASGNIYRAYFRVTTSITFLPFDTAEAVKGRFEFNFDWQYRDVFYENVDDLNVSFHKFITAGFSYTFLNIGEGKKTAKIGFDYTDGDNPSKNFEDQSFYAITLKVKL